MDQRWLVVCGLRLVLNRGRWPTIDGLGFIEGQGFSPYLQNVLQRDVTQPPNRRRLIANC